MVGARVGAGAGAGTGLGSLAGVLAFLAGSGSGALVVFEITGACTFAVLGVLEIGFADAANGVNGASLAEIAPDSKLTSFGGAVFPAKNSSASSAGSAERAGG